MEKNQNFTNFIVKWMFNNYTVIFLKNKIYFRKSIAQLCQIDNILKNLLNLDISHNKNLDNSSLEYLYNKRRENSIYLKKVIMQNWDIGNSTQT